MNSIRTVQDRAKATRESIIAGAAKVFEEAGYGTTSLMQVAEAAGVTKGALYFHFSSKDELALAVIDEQHRLVVLHAEEALRGNHSPLQSIVLMCRAFGQDLVNESVVRAGIRLTLEGTAFGHQIKDPYLDWISTMSHLTEQAKQANEIRASIDPSAFARFLVASFTGVQMVSDVLENRADVLQRIDDMWDFILPGIMRTPSNESAVSLTESVMENLTPSTPQLR